MKKILFLFLCFFAFTTSKAQVLNIFSISDLEYLELPIKNKNVILFCFNHIEKTQTANLQDIKSYKNLIIEAHSNNTPILSLKNIDGYLTSNNQYLSNEPKQLVINITSDVVQRSFYTKHSMNRIKNTVYKESWGSYNDHPFFTF